MKRVVIGSVQRFLMHKRPHLDEVLTRLIIILYGLEQFVGANKAQTIFVEEEPFGTDETFDRDGDVPIGIVEGTRFNEHGGLEGRMEEECSATLAVKFLSQFHPDLPERPELIELLEATRYGDNHRQPSASFIGEVMKAINRVYPDSSAFVLDWSTCLIQSAMMCKKYGIAKVQQELSLLEMYTQLKQTEGSDLAKCTHPEALTYLDEFVAKSMEWEHKVGELSYITRAMFRMGNIPEVKIRRFIEFAFLAVYHDQLAFLGEVKKMQDNPKYVKQIEIQALLPDRRGRDKERSLDLFVCYSDVLQTAKAARFLGADVALVMSSDRSVYISCKTSVKGISLANVAKMLRWLELPPELKTKAHWYELAVPGVYKGAEQWFYFRPGQSLMYGSFTQVAKKESKIGAPAIVEVLQHAFHIDGMKKWCNDRGIYMFERPAYARRTFKREVEVKRVVKTTDTTTEKQSVTVVAKSAPEAPDAALLESTAVQAEPTEAPQAAPTEVPAVPLADKPAPTKKQRKSRKKTATPA